MANQKIILEFIALNGELESERQHLAYNLKQLDISAKETQRLEDIVNRREEKISKLQLIINNIKDRA